MGQNLIRVQRMKRRIWIGLKTILIVFVLVICTISFLNWLTEGKGTWKPDYPKIDLSEIVSKENLSEEDYHAIFVQTGLGRDAADSLLQKNPEENRDRVFKQYQDDFFNSGNYECRVAALIVHDERNRDEEGRLVSGFDVPDLRNGDILITKATHSLGWRHGHAAIVTNAAKGETMEAILLGSPTIQQSITKWETYPSFIQLRIKNHESISADKIAQYAKKELSGIPYGLLTGVPTKAPDDIKKTQCSHLVWYPYERFGYDLDSDGSWLVTPKDIANSDLLEVVQIYGINPEEIWQ